ncbi:MULTISPECIES: DUF3592 domain-containing protein [Mycobacteriaceae]|uniref:DUF3592 domain-containing protein n=1 Tax=Mycolicibacterium mucogenicum DSM 44124 TaxID=1226753 RepID=A0A8H2PE39_MYCMU|nr:MULTISPECIES: DUF3592 domain-containing protein [Mycobacteriaceae]KAB7760661.1 hypothetical protein MMUC44124_06670 [Mycolicibacterium mucogenicum DSM 44124]QPG69519.1 DUF3592 domain-containing protein [Mycolicibacterium mucogenicum DSM 44124]SEB18235.1 Protein of unknown function [Mycobacterium sp. 283mftsu]
MRIEYIVVLIAVIVIVDIAILVALLRKRRARTASADPAPTIATELGTDVPKKSAAPVLAKAFLAVGLSLAVAAGVCAAFVAQSNSSDRHADGTVVELVPSGGGSSPRYRARVEFATSAGTHVRFLSSISSNPPPARLGEHVDVRYNPGDPHDATINTYWQVWFLPTLLGIIAVPFLLVGTGFGIVSRAGRRRGPELL